MTFERRFFLISDKYEQYQAIRRKTDDEWNSAIDHCGMAKSQMMIIWTLWDFGRPCTQKEICEDWYENKQTINSAAKKLENEGIIEMIPSKENFREKLMVFTEKGSAFAEKTVGKLVKAEKAAFDRFTEEEQKEILRLGRKHYELLKEEFDKLKGETK